ncbi:MAG: hypothetical protein QF704_07535 [Anaerolineales bacterium]|jgi:hypothetical protein|nr:hypothetical protein [Anaerolineales bacterium]
MAVTNSVLVNDGGAPARIINFEASETMTAGTAMEITAAGKVAMAVSANIQPAGFLLTDAANGEMASVITGSGIILYVHLDGTAAIAVGDNLDIDASEGGALSKANPDGGSVCAIALEATSATAAANLEAGALFKVLVV